MITVGDDNSCGMTSIVVGRVVIADVSRWQIVIQVVACVSQDAQVVAGLLR
jgi:hypothetical protein